jgi:beta-N-acetylhexosaminidase
MERGRDRHFHGASQRDLIFALEHPERVLQESGAYPWAPQPRQTTRRAVRWSREVMLGALIISVLALLMCAAGPLGQEARAFGAVPAAKAPTTSAATPTLAPKRSMPNEVIVTTSPIDDTVDWYLAHMSLDEKLGQMIMVETYSQDYGGDIAYMVEQQHAGAVIVYKKNMVSPSQLSSMLSGVQAHAGIPLFITMDEEGGNVDRLGDMGFAKPLPAARWLGSTGNPQNAHDAGSRAAAELKAFGINVDLAPVADVRSIPDPVIGPRIYGADSGTVDAYAGSFLDGLQQDGVIGTLKHWPGIGSIALDPHKTLPTDTRSRSQLESTDFAAFRGLLDKQPGMIMVTHVLLNAIDPSMPSSLSPKVVDGTLRGELGYQGVVITDNLWMKGVSLRYSLGEASVLAVLAGDDLLEGPWNPSSMRGVLDALKNAVQSGRISQDRIDLSVRRILTLKAKYGILPLHQPDPAGSAQAAMMVRGEAALPRPYMMVAPREVE